MSLLGMVCCIPIGVHPCLTSAAGEIQRSIYMAVQTPRRGESSPHHWSISYSVSAMANEVGAFAARSLKFVHKSKLQPVS